MKGGKNIILPTQTNKFNKFVLVRWPNDKPGLFLSNILFIKYSINKTKQISIYI